MGMCVCVGVCACVCICLCACVSNKLSSVASIDADDLVDDEVCDNTTHTQSEIITLMLSFADEEEGDRYTPALMTF